MREAIVTGGTGALGRAVVAELRDAGTRCHVTWIDPRELEGLLPAPDLTLHQVDCRDESAVADLYATLPQVEASIHLVGGFAMGSIEATSLDRLESLWRLNATTAFLCCREAVRVMRGHGRCGRIVNVAARPVLEPAKGMAAYAMAKAAVASLTQCLADETRDANILVNAVVPALIDSPANRAAMPDANFAAWPTPADVARAVGFLAGTANTLSSGCLLPVYGRA